MGILFTWLVISGAVLIVLALIGIIGDNLFTKLHDETKFNWRFVIVLFVGMTLVLIANGNVKQYSSVETKLVITADTGVDEEYISTLKNVAASGSFTKDMRNIMFSYDWHLTDKASITNDYNVSNGEVTIYVGAKDQYKYRIFRVLKEVTAARYVSITQR